MAGNCSEVMTDTNYSNTSDQPHLVRSQTSCCSQWDGPENTYRKRHLNLKEVTWQLTSHRKGWKPAGDGVTLKENKCRLHQIWWWRRDSDGPKWWGFCQRINTNKYWRWFSGQRKVIETETGKCKKHEEEKHIPSLPTISQCLAGLALPPLLNIWVSAPR